MKRIRQALIGGLACLGAALGARAQCLFLPTALDGVNGISFNSQTHDLSGQSVSLACDINHDGIGDVIIGARRAYSPGTAENGESFVVFGRDTQAQGGFDAAISLQSLGDDGFVLRGADAFEESGWSVSRAGDVNGDGIDDVIIGAPRAKKTGSSIPNAGRAYLVFGRDSGAGAGFPSSINLAFLSGAAGVTISGIGQDDECGSCVSGAGDVNADGIDDIIIGAPKADPGGSNAAGVSYVVFGALDLGANGPIDPATLDGTNGFVFQGASAGDACGTSVSGAGDINGDGISDLVIGAGSANNDHGETYVVFGRDASQGGFPAAMSPASLDGSTGFTCRGAHYARAGDALARGGDVNGDGRDDLLIGAPNYRGDVGPAGYKAGATYVLFGRDTSSQGAFATLLDLDSLDGSDGFAILGIDSYDQSGSSVSGAGDFNGDGYGDMIIGAPGAGRNGDTQGEAYVVLGGPNVGAGGVLNLSSLDSTSGLVFSGIGDEESCGTSVGAAGDFNADGFGDVLVGAPARFYAGYISRAYVIFGKPGALSPPALGPATLVSPPDDAVSVGLKPILQWAEASNASEYGIEIASDTLFEDLVYSTTRDAPAGPITMTTALQFDSLYYWRVISKNCDAEEPSEVFSFTTIAVPPPPPDAFSLTSPSDGAFEIGTAPTLEWTPAAGTEQYLVEMDTLPTFNSGIALYSATVPAPSTQVDLPEGVLSNEAQYYWRVTAENSGGSTACQPGYHAFLTAPATPEPFVLTTPINGATDIDRGPVLSWSGASGATQYVVTVSTDAGFANPIISSVLAAPATSLTLPDETLGFGEQYFWRVTAENVDPPYGTSVQTGIPSSSTFTTLPTCLGDFDGDRDTDIFDFAIFINAFGSTPEDPNWNPDADVYANEHITVLDFAYLAGDFGCDLN